MVKTMLAHRYQIWQWGGQIGRVNTGTEMRRVGVATIAKRSCDSDFEVFNELVAMHLGRAIGLPIPPGIVLENKGSAFFASLQLGIAGADLPPADVEAMAANLPSLTYGVVLFDAWIGNDDRHCENFWYDEEEKEAWIFDHGHSLVAGGDWDRLDQLANSLVTGMDNSELVQQMRSFDGFSSWLRRIQSLTKDMIDDTVRNAAKVLKDPSEIHRCGDWLNRRRWNLARLFDENRHQFPKLQSKLFDEIGEHNRDSLDYQI